MALSEVAEDSIDAPVLSAASTEEEIAMQGGNRRGIYPELHATSLFT